MQQRSHGRDYGQYSEDAERGSFGLCGVLRSVSMTAGAGTDFSNFVLEKSDFFGLSELNCFGREQKLTK